MNQEIANKLSIARSRLLLDHPFFGVLALRLQLVEDAKVPTLATDGRKIYYNPDFISELPIDLCSSAMAHEVMHNVMEHGLRRQGRNPRKWNVAADYAINPIIKYAGMKLGQGWLDNSAYYGMSADEIYALLPDGDGEGGGGEEPLCDIQDFDQATADELEVEWKMATVQAAKGVGQGNLPAGIKQIIQDILTPPVPWREVLSRFMTEQVRNDYSFKRPNPYFASSGFYLPTLDGRGMGEVVIALDTSGSVASVLDEFGATVKGIIAGCAPLRTHIIYCDAAINHVQTFERGTEVTFEAVGGGGTDFRPVFEHVKNNSIKPACLLYLTDMYGSFPQEEPDYPVLWCATSHVVGPFGETLKIAE